MRYLLAATENAPPPRGFFGGRGSLKHLLWWLRDHAGEMYVPAVQAALSMALEHPDIPLSALTAHALDHPLLGVFASTSLASPPAHDLADKLLFEELPKGRTAWNFSTTNLAKVAFRSGARFYAAISAQGGCLMGARGVLIEAFPLPPTWVQPYPNLVVFKEPGTAEHEATIRRYLAH
ncbi:MAG: hypothetical protein D6690_14670 [Nitrospirae bacterium]|nr:MAG: hypothetical protein D6690_14670 [Nitrospirota bacterium]